LIEFPSPSPVCAIAMSARRSVCGETCPSGSRPAAKSSLVAQTRGDWIPAQGRYDGGGVASRQPIHFHLAPTIPRKTAHATSPPSQPVPTITPFRFGYTGQHCRRGGAGDRVGRPDASGPYGAAQKMVCPLNKGVRVSHTSRMASARSKPNRRRRTGVARKNTPNGARRVSPNSIHTRHTTCPGRTSNFRDRQGASPSSRRDGKRVIRQKPPKQTSERTRR